MRTNEYYILREIAGDNLLVPVGEATQRLNGMVQLTETAAFIWNHVNEAKDLEELVKMITDEYEVDEETARNDVFGFTKELYMREMILDVPEFKDVEIIPVK